MVTSLAIMCRIEPPSRRFAVGWPLIALLSIAAAGLGCRGTAPAAPRPAEPAALDPEVAALIHETADALDAKPGDRGLRTRLGMIYQANELHALAELTYQQVLDRHPGDARVWFHLAACRRLRGDLGGALEALAETVRHRPEYPPPQARLAMWLLDAGRTDDAADTIERARSMDSKGQEAAARELAFAAVRLHLQRREAEPAIELIESRGLIAGPNAPYGRHLLATAHRMAGSTEAARRAGAPPARPAFPDPWTRELAALRAGFNRQRSQAVALLRRGDFAAALPLFEELRRRDPRDQRLLGMLAQCYLSTGAVGQALAASTAAALAAADDFAARINLAKVTLIAARQGNAELESALAHADAAVALRPGAGDGHVTRASVLFALDRRQEAVTATRRAWELDARNPAAMLRAGSTLLQAASWRQAGEIFDTVLAAHPRQPSALLGRARAEMELGELTRAAATLAEIDPAVTDRDALAATRRRLLGLRSAEGGS